MRLRVVRKTFQVLAGLLLLISMSACSVLPGTGPSSESVENYAAAGVRSTTALPYALVDVSADTIGFLSQPNVVSFKGSFKDRRPKPQQVVGVGDVLNISIFEAAPGGLFTPGQSAGARPGNFVDLPPQAVDQRGNISVPYAGEVPAAGRTLPEVQQAVVARLRNRAIEPQVVVSLNQQHSSVVSVLGDVNAPGVFALNSVGEKLLAVVARAGGPKYEAIESYVTLQRDGKKVKVLLSRIVHDPSENIFIRPNDVIFITREAPTFTALGALNQNVFGYNSELTFDVETLTLAQAIGKAGGLNDQQSDPAEVFVFRYEDRPLLEKLGVDTNRFVYDRIPTIYHVNLRDPSGMLLASGFQIRSKDVMYVANARVVDYYKLLTLINNTANTTSNVSNAAINVNAATKTRW
ncbi:polysaccharide export protein [Rhodopseudomonas sp. BR0C11]|jgi:polysaccharide export outer membrane protein|uniref:Polysaccharide export protein n=1 Tax=Rhodopseudomonas palustris TaxID=1076 RepID=A0AAX3DU49_RHOPL|nr:polysaccharide export protein [Rhodopseudomonas sp. BR0C11]NEW97930.1 polysaccharide export protein [Rhodopseudomonas sp. BR0G17]UYO38367.1 polysaccharide export protein [Rhodopseudomonas palustris]UYO47719.1 polysaccharide export protein [Rhodopseudomonas palustris]UYO52407.1 polysaccharide export protein [Rhodopseudomonas palustris]